MSTILKFAIGFFIEEMIKCYINDMVKKRQERTKDSN
jgi:hypothetical protein